MDIPNKPFKILIQPLQDGGNWISETVKPDNFNGSTWGYTVKSDKLSAYIPNGNFNNLLETGEYIICQSRAEFSKEFIEGLKTVSPSQPVSWYHMQAETQYKFYINRLEIGKK